MRDVNGWVVGAVGAAALVGAFFLGGRVTASPALSRPRRRRRGHGRRDGPGGIEFGCAPGQRVVMREATATTSPRRRAWDPAIDPLTRATPPGAGARRSLCGERSPYRPLARAPYVRRAVITEPLEVYRPRSGRCPTERA